MIKEKLAEMAIKTYVLESAVYRCAGLIDRVFNTMDKTRLGQEIADKLPEYALECSITKLFGSEISANIVDEAVQIHGGYGLLEDYPVEGLYRDARSSRILEGTSEVNRIIICKTILRALKNESLPLKAKINELRADLKKRETIIRQSEGELVTAAKEAFLFTLSVADEKLGDNLKNTQEILGRLTNIALEVFAMESALIRTQKVKAMAGENKAELKAMMAKAYIYTAMPALEKNAAEIMAAICETEEAVENISVIKSILKHVPQNVVALRTEIAKAVSNEEKYPV
jgi:alkylation response protein AidB-like acyl-CoA dehydrogenase